MAAVRSFMEELTVFKRTIAGERTPLALGRDGLKAVEIANAIYRSTEEKQSIRLVAPF